MVNIQIKLSTYCRYCKCYVAIEFTAMFLTFQLNAIGPKLLFNGGIFTTGTCAILFG